jgi:signal peptidase I
MTVVLLITLCCLGSVLVLACAALRRGFAMVVVSGVSMLPTFRPGDRVLVRRSGPKGVEVGCVVVLRSPASEPGQWMPAGQSVAAGQLAGARSARHAAGPGPLAGSWVIKRVAALPGDPVPDLMRSATADVPVVPGGQLLVCADNDSGTDSRQWGFIPVDRVLGPVVRTVPERVLGEHRSPALR